MYTTDLEARDLGSESTNIRIDSMSDILRRERDGMNSDSGSLRRSTESTASVQQSEKRGHAHVAHTDRGDTWQPIKA